MSFLEEHFELLTRTPENAAKLKDLILQLAVQGKLVPQDPNDEPASVLLERIKLEKERFIKESEIKREKPQLHITDDKILFELPKGWSWNRLGDFLTFTYGKSLTKDKRSDIGEYPVYGSNGIVGYHNQYLCKNPAIIIGRKGSAGALNFCHLPSWTTDVAYYIEIPQNLVVRFLFFLLQTCGLDRLAKGIKPGLNRNEAYEIIVALPPLNEQKRIVERVESLIEKVEKLEKANADGVLQRRELGKSMLHYLTNATGSQETQKYWHLIENNFEKVFTDLENVKELRKTCLQLAVQGKLVPQDPTDEPASVLLEKIREEKQKFIKEGKIKKGKPLPPIEEDEIPYELPDGWVWCRLKAITHNFGQKKPNRKFTYIDVSSINNRIGSIDNNCQILLPEEAPSRARKIVKKNCVIYSTVRPYLLNITIIDRNFKYEPIVSTAFAVLNPILVNNKYFLFYLRSKVFTEYVEGQMIGMAYPAINDNKLYLGLIPLPPLNEQKRIVEKVDRLMRLCDSLEEKIKESDEKMGRMMRGVVQG